MYFQTDVVAADDRLINLGLLFAADMDVSLEEQPEYYSFHHKLIQEHLAATFLTKEVKQNRETFSNAFPGWWVIHWSHRELIRFMMGSGAPIMDHLCKAYADYLVQGQSINMINHSDIDLSLLNDFQKEAVSASPALLDNTTMPIATYGCSKDQGTPCLPIREALLSSYIVLVQQGELRGLLPLAQKNDMHDPCQHQTRALFMSWCSYKQVHHVMRSIQGIPITHLFMNYCGVDYSPSDSDRDYSNDGDESDNSCIGISCNGRDLTALLYEEDDLISPILCRQAKGIFLRESVLPVSLLRDLGYEMHGCEQFHTLSLDVIDVVKPDGSVLSHVTDNLPDYVVANFGRGLRHLNKLEILNLNGDLLDSWHITQAINTWEPESQLRVLDLFYCMLTSTEIGDLLQALATKCHKLDILKLGGSDLGGQLAILTSNSNPLLNQLWLPECKLEPADGHALADAIQNQRLPKLGDIRLEGNPGLNEKAGAAILSAALSLDHQKGWVEIDLDNCEMSAEFEEEWKQKCNGTHVRF